METKSKIHTVAFGQAGVHRTIAHLIMLGYQPYSPVADTQGVDLWVPPGVRLQVKSTQLYRDTKHESRYRAPSYNFELRCTRTNFDGSQYRKKRSFSEECDFVILWGATEDRTWVVPAHLLDMRNHVALSEKPRWKELDIEALKADRKEGLSYETMAQKYGVAVWTIWQRINSHYEMRAGAYTKAVRDCEGRWDLIEQFIADRYPAKAEQPTPDETIIEPDVAIPDETEEEDEEVFGWEPGAPSSHVN